MKRASLTILAALACLLASAQQAEITVAQDGTGDFMTVQEAIDACPDYDHGHITTIFIREGVYKEMVTIPHNKFRLHIRGAGADKTVITFDKYAEKKWPGTDRKIGTSGSATMYIHSSYVTLEDLTVENSSGEGKEIGQGVFDLRKSRLGILTITESTIKGGRDLVRADASTITGAFSCTANTIDGSNLGVNGNAIMYVRATPESYVFKNNLFLNEKADGKSVLLSKTSGITVPTLASGNYVWNYDETNFFSGLFTKEVAEMTALSADPVKDSANGDYTVTDATVKAAGAGASRWR